MIRIAAVAAVAVSLAAQEPRFDVRSRLVLVPVTVTDQRGRSVDGLGAADFLVFDNGRPQKAIVDTIDTGVAPIALVIAVQSSGISAAVLEKTRRIAGMIQPLISGERGCAGLVSFDQNINWLQECTQSGDAFERSFSKLRPVSRPGEDKEARMLDAVDSAIERLRQRPGSRRVLLLISESRDRGSEADLEAVAIAAQAFDVTVYAATYSALKTAFTSKEPVTAPRTGKPKTPINALGTVDAAPPSKYNRKISRSEQQVDVIAAVGELMRLHRENAADVLTRATGGAIFSFTRQKGLEEAIMKLGAELHTQYVVSFVPDQVTPGFHTIDVRLGRPSGSRVRARPGYWSKEELR